MKDNNVFDKNSDKYKIALKFINKILINLKKDELDDLTNFKNIDRENIILDINKKTLNDMEKEIFKYFDKAKCGYYRRNDTKHYILTFLRCICNDLNLSFSYYKKDITEIVNNKNYRKTHVYYSITQTHSE